MQRRIYTVHPTDFGYGFIVQICGLGKWIFLRAVMEEERDLLQVQEAGKMMTFNNVSVDRWLLSIGDLYFIQDKLSLLLLLAS